MPDLEKNKQLARDFFERIWNQGDESAIDRFIAEGLTGTYPKLLVVRGSFK
jgi:hypothetical protein